MARGVDVYRRFKSAITTPPQGRVPIFWVQGFTDPLFSGLEAIRLMNRVLDAAPGYPFKLFLGDLGHDYTGQRQDEWDLVKAQMNDFLDHHLRPDRTPTAPTYDVGATVTRCLDHDAPMRYIAAPQWHDLHPAHLTLTSAAPGLTTTLFPGPAGLATDPITTATLPLPGAYRGCRIMRPSQPDPTVATYELPVVEDIVLMGGAVIDVSFTTTGPDVPLSARLWDVTRDGSAQGLVTRGTFRVADGPGATSARYQLAPQGYRFPAGHRIKLEVTANDAPYFQPSNIPAVVAIDGVELTLPLRTEPPAAAPAAPANLPRERDTGGLDGAAGSGGSLPATGGTRPGPAVAVLSMLAAALTFVAGRSRRAAQPCGRGSSGK